MVSDGQHRPAENGSHMMTCVRVRRRLLSGRSAKSLLLDVHNVALATRVAYNRWDAIESLPTRFVTNCKLSEAGAILLSNGFFSGPAGKAVINLVSEDLVGVDLTLPSGTETHKIVFRGGTLRGGALLSGGLIDSGDPYWSLLPTDIRSGVRRYNALFEVELPRNTPLIGGTRVLRTSGDAMKWSRWPKTGWVTPTDTSYHPSSQPTATIDAPKRKFLVDESQLPSGFSSIYYTSGTLSAPLHLQVFSSYCWRDELRVPEKYDPVTKVMELDQNVSHDFGRFSDIHRCRFRIVNHFAGLGAGEYFVAPELSAIYAQSDDNELVVGGNGRLVGVASDVWFDNTLFEGFNREVFANTLTRCGWHNCVFRGIGTLHGRDRPNTDFFVSNTIVRCQFYDVSQWAIMCNNLKWKWPSSANIVADCVFERLAELRWMRSYATLFNSCNDAFTNNEVRNTPSGGVRLWGGANQVVANRFIKCVESPHADVGVIYAGRSYNTPYNVIAYNEISHTAKDEPIDVMAIYLDDSISGQIVLNNKLSHYEKTITLRQGKDTIAIGNTINDGQFRNSSGQYPSEAINLHVETMLNDLWSSVIVTSEWRDNWPEVLGYESQRYVVTDQICYGNKVFNSNIVRNAITFEPGNRWDEPEVLSEADRTINFAGPTWL